jgi:hypothetical protein
MYIKKIIKNKGKYKKKKNMYHSALAALTLNYIIFIKKNCEGKH